MHTPLRPQQDQYRPGNGYDEEDSIHRPEDETDSEEVLGDRRVPEHVEGTEEITHCEALRQAPDHRGSPGQDEEIAPE